MSYSQMVDLLKEKHKDKVLFMKTGAFYVAFAEDAVLLNNKLKLKCICYKNNICKVGIPVNYIDKYLEKIEHMKYSYIVYKLDKTNVELIQEKIFEGKPNKVKRKNINCLMCKGISAHADDIYMEALSKINGNDGIE